MSNRGTRLLRLHGRSKLLLGLITGFAALQATAIALGSDRGQGGVLVAVVVVAVVLSAERILFQSSARAAFAALGLGLPAMRGICTAAAISGLLLLVVPTLAHLRHSPIVFDPDWSWLLPGLFAQAGIAEEVVFRGYLFGHLRRQHAFWPAAGRATVPFVLVHLLLFVSLPWWIALAALLLSVLLSLPLAHLFELSGNTIWGPALLHAVVQGSLKIATLPEDGSIPVPLLWMAASATIPFLVFLIPRRSPGPA